MKTAILRSRRTMGIIIGFLALHLLLAGCAPGSRETISVREPKHEKSIKMIAGSYYFDPAVIQASPGDFLRIQIENIAGMDHNFTIEDPAGEILHSIDLPAGSTSELEIQLGGPGVYRYHCDIRFHPTLGMTGRVEVQ
jgi:plastocyanin